MPRATPDVRETPHYHGHRARLRARLLDKGAAALEDYELLELLLFAAIPRRDVKPLAKALLKEFGSLWALAQAPLARLKNFRCAGAGLPEGAVALLLGTGALALRAKQQEIFAQPLLQGWEALLDYCQAAMGTLGQEQFRVLFLDRKWRLLGDEVQQTGTIDHTPVYPREVARRALELAASAVVLVHNHPSGDPAPSKEDIAMTRQLALALSGVGVTVHDHIIVGRTACASFKNLGLL